MVCEYFSLENAMEAGMPAAANKCVNKLCYVANSLEELIQIVEEHKDDYVEILNVTDKFWDKFGYGYKYAYPVKAAHAYRRMKNIELVRWLASTEPGEIRQWSAGNVVSTDFSYTYDMDNEEVFDVIKIRSIYKDGEVTIWYDPMIEDSNIC